MKKFLTFLLLIFATTKLIFASTGYRSDDYVIIVVPVVFLAVLWIGNQVVVKLRERNKPKQEEETMHPENLEDAATDDTNVAEE